MKKVIFVFLALLSLFNNRLIAQTAYFTNRTCGDVLVYHVEYSDCVGGSAGNPGIIIPAGTSIPVGYYYTSLVSGTAGPGGLFFSIKVGTPAGPSCDWYVSGPGVLCPTYDGVKLEDFSLITCITGTTLLSSCYEISTATCSSCRPRTSINARWTDLVGGDIRIDLY